MGSHSGSAGKVFIGGLCWDSSNDTLREYFSKYGELTDAVIMRDKSTGRSRGFGFVTFANPSCVDAVMNEQHNIDGRNVEVKRAVPKEDMGGEYAEGGGFEDVSPSGTFRTRKIFVGGLPHSTSDQEFRSYFAQFGSITDAQVMTDRDTGRPRGFGFVSFESEDTVDKIMSQSHEIGGKQVELKRAEPKRPLQLSVASREDNKPRSNRGDREHSSGRDNGRGSDRGDRDRPSMRDGRESYGPGPRGYGGSNMNNMNMMGNSNQMGMGDMGFGQNSYEPMHNYHQRSSPGPPLKSRNQPSPSQNYSGPPPRGGHPPHRNGGPTGYSGGPNYGGYSGGGPGYGGAPGYSGGPGYGGGPNYGSGSGYDGGGSGWSGYSGGGGPGYGGPGGPGYPNSGGPGYGANYGGPGNGPNYNGGPGDGPNYGSGSSNGAGSGYGARQGYGGYSGEGRSNSRGSDRQGWTSGYGPSHGYEATPNNSSGYNGHRPQRADRAYHPYKK